MEQDRFEFFLEAYDPQGNHITKDTPFDGCMFGTSGEDLEYVRQQGNQYIWTLMECDGEWLLSPGYHWINRYGYFVCKLRHYGAQTLDIDLTREMEASEGDKEQ